MLRRLRRKLRVAGRGVSPDLQVVAGVQGSVSLAEAGLLTTLAARVDGSGAIVEVGSYRGRSTVALAQGAQRSPIYAIEPHEEFVGVLGGKFGPEDRAAFFRAMCDTGAYAKVRLVNLTSDVVAPGWTTPVSLLWLDGDHTYEGVSGDWRAWSPHLTPDALVAFDDSLDEALGPHRLIAELVAAKELIPVESVGKVSVLRRPGNGAPAGAGPATASAPAPTAGSQPVSNS